MTAEEIYRKAIETYGAIAQRNTAIEEMAELIDALMKHQRGRNMTVDVIDEIADVTIMMRQMAIMFGKDEVESRIIYKVRRLAERIGLED